MLFSRQYVHQVVLVSSSVLYGLLIPDGNFRWIRTSRDTESDRIWNAAPRYGREIDVYKRQVQYKGVIDCDNTVLRQFNISRLIIQGYTLQPTEIGRAHV